MRKMFTKLFGLTLLVYLISSFTVAQAQTCDHDPLSEDDVVLQTDISTVCDGGNVQYAVIGFESDSTLYSFNGVNDTTAGGFNPVKTFTTVEGRPFWVEVKMGSCSYGPIYYSPKDTVSALTLDTVYVTQPRCWDEDGELTLVVGGSEAFEVFYVDSATGSTWTPPFNANFPATYPTPVDETQFLGIPGHTYYLGVQSANANCQTVYWDTVHVNAAPNPIMVDSIYVAATDSIDCIGGEGIITVMVDTTTGVPFAGNEYDVSIDFGATKVRTVNGIAQIPATAGEYWAVAYDSVGCVSDQSDSSAVLIEPEEVTFDISLDDIACADSTDGAIYVHTFGGPAGDSVYLAHYGADTLLATQLIVNDSAKFMDLKVGYYSVWVGNNNGLCDSVAYVNPNGTGNVISLQAPATVDLTVDVVEAVCAGDSSEITASATGGSGNYMYKVETLGGTDISGGYTTTSSWTVGADTFLVYVQDDGGCEIQYETPIALEVIDPISIDSINTISPTCPGANDGLITVYATGSGTIWYSLDSTSWKVNNTFAVYAGDYKVYVKTEGCDDDVAVDDAVTVTALDTNVIELVSIDSIECNGAKDGAISVKMTSWAQQTTEDRYVRVYYSLDEADVYVEGAGTMMTGPAPDSTYSASSLEAGTYYIWAMDTLGCKFDACACGTPDTLIAVITEEDPLTVEGTVTDDATCYGDYDGILTIYAAGGMPTHYGTANTKAAGMNLPDGAFIPWPAGADSVNIQVGMGTYYAVVKDDCGKRAISDEFYVDGWKQVMIVDSAMSVTDNECALDTAGVIEVYPATGGTDDGANLVYTLLQSDDGFVTFDTVVFQTTETVFTGLMKGSYKVVVTDLGGNGLVGCDGTETGVIDVDAPAAVESENFDFWDISCKGAADGLITVEAVGGAGDYEFKVNNNSWRPFDAGDSIKNIVVTKPGTYIVWLRDSSGCVSLPDTAIIKEPAALVLDITTAADTAECSDLERAGEINGMVYGGNNTDSVLVSIVGGSISIDSLIVTDSLIAIDTLPAGTYIVTAMEIGMNSRGCSVWEEVMIAGPDSLMAEATILDSVGCYGQGGGEILVEVTGGTAPYSVQLPTVDTMTIDTMGGNVIFDNLKAGDYAIVVLDDKGCKYELDTITIAQSDSLTLAATWISDITCGADGAFSVQAGGGSGEFVYYAHISVVDSGHIIVPDPMTSDEWQTDSTFSVTVPGTYIVWAYDTINGCMVGGEYLNGVAYNPWRVKIGEPDIKVTVNAVVEGNAACAGGTLDIIVPADSIMITQNGLDITDPTKYTVWIDTMETDTLSDVDPGIYIVTVMHESGCYGIDSVVIDEPVPFEVMLDKGEGEFACPDATDGYIEATVSGVGDTLMYQLWQDTMVLTDYQANNSFLVEINNVYTVVVMNEFGCTDTSEPLVLEPVEEAGFSIKDVSCYSDSMASAKVIVTGEPGRSFKLFWDELETSDMGETDYFMGDTILSQFFEFDEKSTKDRHYIMWVEDSEGCESMKDTLTFKRVDGPLQVVNVTDTVGDCATTFSFEIAGGTAPYMVMVDTAVVADSIGFYQRITLDLAGGTHNVYVLDAHECELEYNFDLQYGTVIYDSVRIYVGDTAHYMEYGLDTMLVGGDYEFVLTDDTTDCATQLLVNVHERPRTAPVVDTMSPMGTTVDNHPVLEIVFTDDVTFGEAGQLTITAVDSSTPSVTVDLTSSDLITNGNTVTIAYDLLTNGGLDTSTTYVVHVDSGVFMGDGLAWGGISDDTTWTFTTGPDYQTGIAPDVEALEFKVYPNPFNNFIRIDNAEKLDRVLVSNIAGQRVLDIENPTYEIRTGNLVTGVYVVTLISNDEIVKSERIIKR